MFQQQLPFCCLFQEVIQHRFHTSHVPPSVLGIGFVEVFKTWLAASQAFIAVLKICYMAKLTKLRIQLLWLPCPATAPQWYQKPLFPEADKDLFDPSALRSVSFRANAFLDFQSSFFAEVSPSALRSSSRWLLFVALDLETVAQSSSGGICLAACFSNYTLSLDIFGFSLQGEFPLR